MNVIGISGFEGAVPFKRRHWPSLDPRAYRISQGHDAAAALVSSGRIVAAAAEERFDRNKHSAHFPVQAIRWCLEQAGLSIDDVDMLAHGFDYGPYRTIYSADPTTRKLYEDVLSRDALVKLVERDLPGFPVERVCQVPHHVAHAASAYWTSGWDECLVIVVDAMGEAHGSTIFQGRGGELTRLRSIGAQDSIGVFYSLVTYHLGFDFNSDEYKIMGLAPYGDPSRYREFFAKEVVLRDDGTIKIPMLQLNTTRDDRENYGATLSYLSQHLLPARDPAGDISDEHRDVAAALQECLDNVMQHICGSFQRASNQSRLALAGGVALNCTANGRLIKAGLFDEIYVQPAAGDDGTALGAALYASAKRGVIANKRMPAPLLGPSHDAAAVDRAIAAAAPKIKVQRFASLAETCTAAAQLIAQGKVLAWHRGRMEFGPRALGNRSILADPGHPEMRDRINSMVKKREAFRPFAPAVSLGEVHKWFDVAAGSVFPYMIAVVDVREAHRASLPAITHVNGSARVQTVSDEDNPAFHALLRAVGRTTGREMVLNTSFNVKGQPIVNTPDEAIATFLDTGIDHLFVENNLISRA
ncbi:MAG TPA: carbamoyltransferase C-terminal domain-containing protein [Gemmatimonadaceae bacterium]|jgi:carbamoyltransferase|nr:carbamoyltransferase C-terminal domain-containing protein [Gemmatimonadaceae bacterium]